MENFNTGLKDVTGRVIRIGDKIRFLHVDAIGRVSETNELEKGVYTVEFQHGWIVGVIEDRNPEPLLDHVKPKDGRYIPNSITLVEHVDDEVLCVVVDQ